jgi:hypothetical protein
MLDIASAVNHGQNTDWVNIRLKNDYIRIEREKQHMPSGEVSAAVALPGQVG